MRDIISPLSGIRSPFGRLTSALAIYAVIGSKPSLVFDFANEKYFTGSHKTNFENSITYTGASNKTMVDSDGLLKWAPHNLLLRSEEFDNASWLKAEATVSADAVTAPNGLLTADKLEETTGTNIHTVSQSVSIPSQSTISVWMKAAERTWGYIRVDFVQTFFDLSSGVVGTDLVGGGTIEDAGNGWWKCSVTTTDTSYILRVGVSTANGTVSYAGTLGSGIYLWGAHVYRSDLGGMVDNPDTGNSYVPTTTTARYLPRRGHHVYNGSAWVNEGLLVESEARTNLATYSEDFTDVYWEKQAGTGTLSLDAVGPDGQVNSAVTLVDNSATGVGRVGVDKVFTYSTSTDYTLSIYAKADGVGFLHLRTLGTTTADGSTWFNLSTGTTGTASGSHTANIDPSSDGWYRCSITITTDAADNTGQFLIYAVESDGDFDATLDGTSSILIYGAQLEAGSTPSSYIPNAGTPSGVTRAAETLTVAAADLPYPTPRVIGPELVTNGTFDTDTTGWAANGTTTLSVASGALRITHGANEYAYTPITTVIGETYTLTLDVIGGSGASYRILVGTAAGNGALFTGATTPQGTAHVPVSFTATGTTHYISIQCFGTGYQDFDNISVREIDPLSVSIQMQGRMTYADEGALPQHEYVRWYADASNYVRWMFDTQTGTGGPLIRQASGGVVDAVVQYSAYSPGINVPFNIASRNGSTFINGAVDGTAITADTTPVALPDLSATNLSLAYDYMGCLKLFRMWDQDLADAGIAAASAPSLEPSLSLLFDGSSGSFTVDNWSE